MTQMQSNALKAAAVLWVLWGLVHTFAGVMTILGDPTTSFQNIADGVPPDTLVADYAAAVGGVLNQHGWNLGWFGIATIIGAVFIWRGNMTAIWVTAMIGGLADLGYFMFLDLAGFVNFVPGTVMTLISASAIVLSGWVWVSRRTALPA